MRTFSLLTAPDLPAYDKWARSHEHGTLWQSPEWRRLQETLGRSTRLYALKKDGEFLASASISIDRTMLGLSAWDIPRGPLFRSALPEAEKQEFLSSILVEARKDRCLSLTFSPILPLTANTSKRSPRHEQPEATRIIDLRPQETDILKSMKPKGRYNIAVAQRHGIRIEHSTDTDAFHALLATTAKRDGFSPRPTSHYRTFLDQLPGSFLLLAYAETTPLPVAGLLGVIWGKTGIYYYGASDYVKRALMAPYLLQWKAMQHCKAGECDAYDLLGIAPPDAKADHPWQGVSGFKEKFGGTVVTYPPEQQITLRPFLSALLSAKRKILR